MARRLISTDSPFERRAGYSRAVVEETAVGTWCFVSGTTGYDYRTMTMPAGIAEQTRNALATIESVLVDAGLSLGDIVRIRYIITQAADRDPVFDIAGKLLGGVRPAATMLIAGLIETEMKVEIEATAFRPSPSG